MVRENAIAAIQACITNQLERIAVGDRRIAGVIGDAPSQYSKSPALWNAAFRLLSIDAIYIPFDIEQPRLKDFAAAMRDSERMLGVNVTLPHKLKIMEYLDEIDAGAARVQAVNTIVRAENGKLVGYNTDGEGFVASILKPQPGRKDIFIESLVGMNVLLLGAGGSARAVALHAAELLRTGELLICNRTQEHAEALVDEIRKLGHSARAVPEGELPAWTPRVGLIINSTTKGQGGLRRPERGKVTTMEPYSALAPAHPAAVPESEYGKPQSQESVVKAFQADIQKNNETSMRLAASFPKNVRFYDLIYFPEETVFLRHGKLTGHRTMNGKGMLINQAAIGFCKRICRAEIQARKLDEPETYQRVLEAMYGAW
jgi:shikimate dehydrogenase